MSSYPEHKEYYLQKKKEGYETIILEGFYADDCLYWHLQDFLDAGFKVVVPLDLVAARDQPHPITAFEDFITQTYQGKVIFTTRERVMHSLIMDESERTLPEPTVTGEELNNICFGFGG